MAITYVGEGAGSETTAAHAAGHIADDFSVLFVECVSGVVTTPAGWTPVATVANAAGTTKLSIFSIACTSGAMGNAAIAGGSGDHLWARIHTFRGVDLVDPWTAIFLAYATAASTSGFVPGGYVGAAGMMVLALAWAIDDATDIASAWADSGLTSVTERKSDGTTTGGGGGLSVATGDLAAAAILPPGTLTLTSTTFACAVLGLREAPATPYTVTGTITIAGAPAANGGTVEIWDDVLDQLETTCLVAGGAGGFSAAVQFNTLNRYVAKYDNGSNRGCSAPGTAA